MRNRSKRHEKQCEKQIGLNKRVGSGHLPQVMPLETDSREEGGKYQYTKTKRFIILKAFQDCFRSHIQNFSIQWTRSENIFDLSILDL